MLCERCQSIFTIQLKPLILPRSIHHQTLASFYCSVQSGCVLCTRVLRAFTRQLGVDFSTWDSEQGFSWWELTTNVQLPAAASNLQQFGATTNGCYELSFGLVGDAYWGPNPDAAGATASWMPRSYNSHLLVPKKGESMRRSQISAFVERR
jgi:hypothetical protein